MYKHQEYQPSYRADIDGLRAIAVVAVVIFHLFDGFLGRGFLGVDVFFVISGFLITTILVRECERGDYSILGFYERRVRRILPALIFVIAVTTIVVVPTFLSTDLLGYGKSVLATFAFVSNIYFWRDTDYFAAEAATKPLLHTWSLGIEEQFYIFFPILLYFLMRLGRLRMVLAILIALTLGSFAINIITLELNKAFVAFYLLPMRAWELGIGAIVAMIRTPPAEDGRVASATGAAGLASIILSLSGLQYAPVWLPDATLACLGTGMLIWSGRQANSVARIIGARPFVSIGLISYSLYLWHWPTFVIAHYLLIRPPHVWESLLLTLFSVGAAYVSWRYVELPFRSRNMPVRRVLRITIGGAVLLSCGAGALIAFKGLPQRFDARSAAFNRIAGTHYRCPISSYLKFGALYGCPANLPSGNVQDADVAILGNSHAQMYVPAIAPELARRGLNGLLVPASGCAPISDYNISDECLSTTRANIAAVKALKRVKVVVIAFAWAKMKDDMVDASGHAIGKLSWDQIFANLRSTIDSFHAAGKQVVLVGPIPRPGYDVASVVSREIAFRGGPQSPLEQSRADFDHEFGLAEAWTHSQPGGTVVALPARRFCDAKRCSFLIDGEPVYADDNHLSTHAMTYFQPMMGEAIDTALARPVPVSANGK